MKNFILVLVAVIVSPSIWAASPGTWEFQHSGLNVEVVAKDAEYDDKRSGDEYLDWSKQWMSQVVRVLKPDGSFWLAIGDDYAAELKVLATRELGLI